MTLHTVTTYTVTCDGTLATACDPSHPDRPHTCPATLDLPPDGWNAYTLDDARWTVARPPRLDGQPIPPARHYCPTHRHQAPTTPDVNARPDDGHVHPDTLPCLAGCPAYGTRQGPLAR